MYRALLVTLFLSSPFLLSFLVMMSIWGSERQEHDLPGRFRGGGRPQTRPLRPPYGPSPRGLKQQSIGVVGPLFAANGHPTNGKSDKCSRLSSKETPRKGIVPLWKLGPFGGLFSVE